MGSGLLLYHCFRLVDSTSKCTTSQETKTWKCYGPMGPGFNILTSSAGTGVGSAIVPSAHLPEFFLFVPPESDDLSLQHHNTFLMPTHLLPQGTLSGYAIHLAAHSLNFGTYYRIHTSNLLRGTLDWRKSQRGLEI